MPGKKHIKKSHTVNHLLDYVAGMQAITKANALHSAQLSSFISQMGSALSSVTHLEMQRDCTSEVVSCSLEAKEATEALLLLPLAHACPKLVQLVLPGTVGSQILQAFGSMCPNLTSLCASINALAFDTLQQLPTLLPHLTSLACLQRCPFHSPYGRLDARNVSATCTALNACPQLLHFDSTPCAISETVWAALPSGLTSCAAAGVCDGWTFDRLNTDTLHRHKWPVHHLHTLTIPTSTLTLLGLFRVLDASPSLSLLVVHFRMLRLTTKYSYDMAEELTLVNARLAAGLKIVTKDKEHDRLIPSKMCLWFNLGDRQVRSFMTAGMLPLPALTDIECCSHNGRVWADLSQLIRIFSGLRELKISDMKLDGSDLLILGSSTALTSLILEACNGVTRAGVSTMCAVSRSLKQLSCCSCQDISTADGQEMEREGWGGTVHVRVGPQRRDGMWD